ncbi:uncharacterized protein LOC107846732 [Capsicum annuum]|uniref:uncharacterized protein LOC107846732 n=1 Tax=Capsicum annuum TaxID=4072 RepID=UPI001FB193C8|nr:uncharacterized protein LOC107846732 [Capsicum annuum]
MAHNINVPWLIAGDFNFVLDASEKKGGNPHKMSDSMPFINCITDNSLIDPGYIGSTFTWCNGRGSRQRMWERLDRAFINYEWSQKFTNTTITHLIKTGSDHSPLLITVDNNLQAHKRCIQDNSDINRMELNNVNAQMIMHTKKEEAYWRQKVGMKWFKEGDANTKIFHSIINAKRNRLTLKKMKIDDNSWVEGNDAIASEAVKFFEHQFADPKLYKGFNILNCLPKVITDDENIMLTDYPSMEEVKRGFFLSQCRQCSWP